MLITNSQYQKEFSMTQQYTLTLVDFQNDFVAPKGALTFDNGKGDTALIERMESFFNHLPQNMIANAIVTFDTHDTKTYTSTAESKQFPPHCIKGTMGWNLAISPSLLCAKIHTIQYLKKATYDMWEGTIDTIDRKILDTTKKVILCGVASDVCNKAALLGWLKKDVEITILEDLTRGIFKQTADVLKEPPFATAVAKGKIKIMTAKAFLNNIKERRYE